MDEMRYKHNDEEFLARLTPTRKKLYWRAIRRGMKEADLLFGNYAREYLAYMTEDEVREFADILHCFDQDLMNWITDKENVPHDINTPTFQKIKAFSPSLFIQ